MKTLRIVIAALLVLAVGALAGIGRPEAAESAESEPREGITVTGVGRVKAVPDQAEFSLGVTTEGTTAREALTVNSARMRELIAALKDAGVADRDIQTQGVSVGRDYDETGPADGFTAQNSVSLLIRDLDRAGAVLEAGSRAGANSVYGPSLTREDRDGFEAKALEQAFAAARKRAEALAGSADVSLGRVTAIVEGVQPVGFEPMVARAEADSTSEVPIEKGTEEIQATVSVTFAID
jgi:hypothetical protein